MYIAHLFTFASILCIAAAEQYDTAMDLSMVPIGDEILPEGHMEPLARPSTNYTTMSANFEHTVEVIMHVTCLR